MAEDNLSIQAIWTISKTLYIQAMILENIIELPD